MSTYLVTSTRNYFCQGLHIRRFQFLHLQKWLWEIHGNAMVLSSAPSDKFATNVKMKAQSNQFGLQWLSNIRFCHHMKDAQDEMSLNAGMLASRVCANTARMYSLASSSRCPTKLFLWIWLCSPRLHGYISGAGKIIISIVTFPYIYESCILHDQQALLGSSASVFKVFEGIQCKLS